MHVDEVAIRLELNETVAAHWTVRHSDGIVHEIAGLMELPAAHFYQRKGDSSAPELGESSPIEGIGVMGLVVDAVEHQRSWFIFHVTDERVFVGKVPISRQPPEAEDVEIVFE